MKDTNTNPDVEMNQAPESRDKLICPRCGKPIDPKEKKCPHCGMKNDLTLCKACGATMAKSAKRCPKCGAKNKKPFYKRISFWVIVAIVLVLMAPTSNTTNTTSSNSNANAPTATSTPEPTPQIPTLELVGGIEGTEGIWDGYSIHVTGQVRNNAASTIRYVEIEFTLYDEQGSVIGTARDNQVNLEPGAVWSFDALGLTKTAVDSYKCSELSYR